MNNKGVVTVYNADGQVVAKESEHQITTDIEPAEEVVPSPPVEIVPIVKDIVEIPVKPEPVEEVKPPEPKPVEPVKTATVPVKKDIGWLVKQDPKKYVLQLIGAYENETIVLYLRAFKNDEDKIISFTASNKGKEWHVLVYGLYDNRDQAVAAIEGLPTKAKLMAPWPRSVQSIKDLLK